MFSWDWSSVNSSGKSAAVSSSAALASATEETVYRCASSSGTPLVKMVFSRRVNERKSVSSNTMVRLTRSNIAAALSNPCHPTLPCRTAFISRFAIFFPYPFCFFGMGSRLGPSGREVHMIEMQFLPT